MEILNKLIQQLDMVLLSTLIAIIFGIPLGIMIHRYPRFKIITLNIVSILWTIPSLALLAFLIPLLGIGFAPAIVALSIYALLPILRNTALGLESVPSASLEAARGLGFTAWQSLRLVELPLALPMIVGGIRTAMSITVGIATIAAFVGAGGLGDFINQGLATNHVALILMGAIPAAILALILDFLIGRVEKLLQQRHSHQRSKKQKIIIPMVIIFISTGLCVWWIKNIFTQPAQNTVIVATKNFSEQLILGEMITQVLAAKTNLHIIKKFDLGTTAITQAAIVRGDIDMYPEYTGTAYLTVLHEDKSLSPAQMLQHLKLTYQQQFNLTWLSPFGFNNTQALAVRDNFAKQYHLQTMSDLVAIEKQLIIAVPAEYKSRPDGFIGLQKIYGLQIDNVKQMDPGLVYQAILQGDVNLINAFSTDGRIPAYHLMLLKDDKHLYPPYYAAIVIREETLKKYPQIVAALKPLFGLIDDNTMQQLNYQVDIQHVTPDIVARKFLVARHII